MSRRHKRRMQVRTETALAAIAEHGRDGASGLQVGQAVTAKWSRPMSMADKEAVGLAMVVRLVRDGLVVATRGNRFMLRTLEGRAVPPALRLEDMPQPGFVRVPGRT
jgi:hypothetical protein